MLVVIKEVHFPLVVEEFVMDLLALQPYFVGSGWAFRVFTVYCFVCNA